MSLYHKSNFFFFFNLESDKKILLAQIILEYSFQIRW